MQSARNNTRPINIGSLTIGGGAPIAVQSMLSAPAHDLDANIRQLERLCEAGCEIVRMAIPNVDALDVFERVCKRSSVPIVADIHFSAKIACEAAYRGAAKLRINPGNIGGFEKTRKVLKAAKSCDIPLRIGVNAGSLDEKISSREDLSFPEKLALSAAEYCDFCFAEGFDNLVVSVKASNVQICVEAYERFAQMRPQIPLHLGITEAGTLMQGLVKSSAGLSLLLQKGLGDTFRISLTEDPVEEVRASWMLLSALGLRKRGVEIISCPTCGRCQVDLLRMASQVEEALKACTIPLKVAVMGCVVNGPGEARDADFGIACGSGVGVLFRQGEVIKKLPEEELVDGLLSEIARLQA